MLDLTFATQQVVDSPEHKQLMALRQSRLRDEEAVDTFFHQVIDSVELDGNYLILLIHDSYDVPYHSKDGEELEDGAQEVYSYILCSICPVKQTKPALSYYVQENQFRSLSPDWIVSPPELGFLFPAFDDRAANLYGALYYTKNTKVMQEDLIEKLFHVTPPMPAAEQKEQFDIALSEALGEACSFEVIQGVQDQLCGMIAEHKESKIKEPLLVDRGTMRQVLATCGVGEQELQEFDEQYTQSFGADTQLSPTNLVNTKQMELQSDYIQIKVDAERTDLIQTRVINGCQICDDSGRRWCAGQWGQYPNLNERKQPVSWLGIQAVLLWNGNFFGIGVIASDVFQHVQYHLFCMGCTSRGINTEMVVGSQSPDTVCIVVVVAGTAAVGHQDAVTCCFFVHLFIFHHPFDTGFNGSTEKHFQAFWMVF